jgi:hypothetical protein
MLSREQILGADDRKREVVEVPEWGGSVTVMSMSGTAKDAFEASIVRENGVTDLTNMRARLVAACVVDEQGIPLFSQADIVALGNKDAAPLSRIATVAQRLNRLGDAQLEELKGN